MEVLQASNPTGLKRLYNNLREASACSLVVEEEEQKLLLSRGEDEAARRAKPRPGGRSGGSGPGCPALALLLRGPGVSSAEGQAPFPSCWFSAPSQPFCVRESPKPSAGQVLPTATSHPAPRSGQGLRLRSGCLPGSGSSLELPGQPGISVPDSCFQSCSNLAESSLTGTTAAPALQLQVRTRLRKHPACNRAVSPDAGL